MTFNSNRELYDSLGRTLNSLRELRSLESRRQGTVVTQAERLDNSDPRTKEYLRCRTSEVIY